jgi:ABC-2 type transport system permease protein
LASTLTANQIIAAMIGLVLVLLSFFITLINSVLGNDRSPLQALTASFAQVDHMDNFSRGVIDSRVLVFYPTVTVLILLVTYHVFQYRRWKA